MIFAGHPELIIGAQRGAPLAVGFGDGEMFVGSDGLALAPLTEHIAYLNDGDWTVVTRDGARFADLDGRPVQREVRRTALTGAAIGKGNFRHYMEKELHEHPTAIGDVLHRMVDPASRAVVLPSLPIDFAAVSRISLAACGSAFYAGLVGRHWFESLARLPCDADVASEFRYRDPPLPKGGLGLLISQSGETADTLAALRAMRAQGQTRALGAQRAREHDGARERCRAGDRGRPRDRGRQHQGVHRAAYRARLPRHRRGARPRRDRARARGRTDGGAAGGARPRRRGAGARGGDRADRRARRRGAGRALSRPRRLLSRSRSRARSSSRRSATSTPRAMRPAR